MMAFSSTPVCTRSIMFNSTRECECLLNHRRMREAKQAGHSKLGNKGHDSQNFVPSGSPGGSKQQERISMSQ